jgi:hypothetical protein
MSAVPGAVATGYVRGLQVGIMHRKDQPAPDLCNFK